MFGNIMEFTLPRFTVHSNNFNFDLQRFNTVSITENNGKYTYNNTEYNSLDEAITAANVKFSVTKTTGTGAEATTTTTYYDAENDFKNDYLTTSNSGTSITGITIYGDVTLQDDTTINLGTDVKNVIKVAKDATLNLGTNTLTINRTGANSATATGNYDTPASAIVVQNGATFNVEGDTTGTINYAWTPTDNNLKASRTSAAVQVGEKVGNYTITDVPVTAAKATFNMKSGNIKSVSTAISMADNGIVSISGGTTESTKSCGIYYGNKSPGGGQITISNGTLQSGANSIYPAIQVSGDIGNISKYKSDAKPAVITITGGEVAFTNKSVTFGSDGKPNGNPDAIYAGGDTKLSISGTAKITSTGTGVELRAGSLTFTGGTVESTATEYKAKTSSASSTSGGQTFGAAIAVTQHETDQSITVNVSGENTKASGAVALVVENTSARTDTKSQIEANLTNGATFESTNAAAIAAKAADSRSKINIENVTFVGNLEDAVAEAPSGGAGTSSPSFNITGTVTIAKKDEKTGELVTVAEYDAETVTLKYNTGTAEKPIYVTVQEGWWSLVANKWLYLVKDTTQDNIANAIATLQPATEGTEPSTKASTTTLELTYAANSLSADSVLALDMTTDIFKDVKYTMLDASKTSNGTYKFKFNITGNDSTASIIGGVGDDTLSAVSTDGVFLDGGTGNDYLIGGDGKDTFAFSSGSDSIIGYTYGTDAVSLATNFTAPTSFDKVSYDGSNLAITFDASNILTFKTASNVSVASGDSTYSYKGHSNGGMDYIALNSASGNGISLGAEHSTVFSGTLEANENYTTIDAANVDKVVRIIGNDNGNYIVSGTKGGTVSGGEGADTITAAGVSASLTLNGGAGDDLLIGGSVYNRFEYSEGNDSISGYNDGKDLINVTNRTLSFMDATVEAAEDNLLIKFDNDNQLSIAGGATLKNAISVTSGSRLYKFTKDYVAYNKGITLTSGYSNGTPNAFDGASSLYSDYHTINAAAVSTAISVIGNSLNNYIFGATAQGGNINGGIGNDKINVSDRSDGASYLFEYTEGKDEVIGFDATKDTVDIAVENITAAKASNSNSKLALTVDKNKNVLTLRSDDEIGKVSLTSGADYLTKDGYVKGQGLSLFGSARGQIDLNDTQLYSGSNISLVAANSVKSQSVTLTGGTQDGTFIYAPNNKKRDGFIYGGGNVSISGYEAGRDRIDLNAASLTSFTVGGDANGDVVLTVGDGTSTGTISISGAADQEVLLHDQNISRGYKKMVFAKTGVIENKQKNPTMVTVSGAAANYSAGTSIKKIYVTGIDREGFSVQAGDRNNTQIDASAAGVGISLSGGAKNDKLIGSSANDLFVYSAGKDVLQGYSDGDSISISSGLADSLGSAKITAGSKSIKFKFTNKDALTVKANKGETLDGSLTIGDTTYTYVKNAIENGGLVTLTSAFGGTFKTDDSKLDQNVTTVYGGAVSKNLTYKGTKTAESLVGGTKKTTFKGGGGGDSLVGGTGKDVFFYAKGEEGTTKIANFEFGANKDKLKIAGGTISQITSVESGGSTAIEFAMNNGKNTSNIGWFDITSGKDGETIDAAKVAIKANNTYYWFATEAGEDVNGNAVAIGQLITSDTRVSASDVSSYSSIIDLNYSTNLAKAGVAVKVTGAKPTK